MSFTVAWEQKAATEAMDKKNMVAAVKCTHESGAGLPVHGIGNRAISHADTPEMLRNMSSRRL
jgi:hypothetical protein